MKLETLKERLEKSELKVTKKQTTIQKKQKSIQKKVDTLLTKYGVRYDYDNRICTNELEKMGLSEDDACEAYWLQCDTDSLVEDVERLTKEIEETKKTIAKYQAQIAGEVEKESMFVNDIPEVLKKLESEMVSIWDSWDISRNNRLSEQYKELGYSGFIKKHKYCDYEFMLQTEDQIHESNLKFARQEILDLYIRVKDVTGEITDWSEIVLSQGNQFPVLNGTVIGKEGIASVESILAGGYNIQRLHIRTLVHKI